ncbi:MAG: ABC transporter ATP-binding protein [Planctomycetia bacterium]|nr:ABC transporter ATP-binding protein [Planctomycetia bacterium]
MNLVLSRLSCTLGKTPVLRDVSCALASGTFTALLGPNGSGKSTLLRCIDALLPCGRDTVLLDGKPVSGFSAESLSRNIAFLPQRCEPSGLTVFDAVLLGRRPWMGWQPSENDYARVETLLERLDLTRLALRPLYRLSGGELQKAALARVLAQDTPLLLLDEPASALDWKNQEEIFTLLRQMTREKNLLVLASLHDVNQAMRYADRLLFLKEGRLFADTTPENVTAEPITSVYGLAVESFSAGPRKLFLPPFQEHEK